MCTLVLALALLWLLPAVGFADGDDTMLPRQAIVRMLPGADLAAFHARHGTTVLRAIPSRQIYLLNLPGTAPEAQIERELENDPDTLWADLHYESRAPEGRPQAFWGSATPDPTPYHGQWATALIGLPEAHRLSQGAGTVVAIVDTGIDPNHPDLAPHLLPGYNAISDTTNVADLGNSTDDDGDGFVDEMTGHGTHVAGIVTLVAPAVSILPVKVLNSDGNSDDFTVALGVYYAIDQQVDVINLSLGSTYHPQLMEDAVAEAYASGIVVVAAGGNVNDDKIESPARIDQAIGVAATNANDQKASFSNYDSRVDLSAPGVAISSTLPGTQYGSWSGTSMATPFVSGGAALLLARHPDWSPVTVTKALRDTARPLDPLNPEHAGELGAGRIALGAAMHAGLPPCFHQGDLDNDGLVTTAEIQTLANTWADPAPPVETDLNRDGHLTIQDLMLAAANWNQPCP